MDRFLAHPSIGPRMFCIGHKILGYSAPGSIRIGRVACVQNPQGSARQQACFSTSGQTFRSRLPGGGFQSKISDPDDLPVYQYASASTKRSTRVYVWGYAESGALGIAGFVQGGKTTGGRRYMPRQSIASPCRLPFSRDYEISRVAAGYGYTVLATDHRVYGTGLNMDSQIGYHEARKGSGKGLATILEPVEIAIPVKKPGKSKILGVCCGRAHTIVNTEEGVFSLGNNAYGQCGRRIIDKEKYADNPLIHKIKDLPDNVVSVVCGLDHTMFLTKDGEVYSCGWSADGQTGLGKYDSESTPSLVKGDIGGEHIVQLAASGDSVLAVSFRGDVFGWGNSEYHQFESASNEPQVNVPRHLSSCKNVGIVQQVAVGSSMCMALNEEGQVYVWGFGVLGKGPECLILREPEMLPEPLFGKNEYSHHTRVVKIASGVRCNAAITNDGSLYTWGVPMFGNLGLGKIEDEQYFPLKVVLSAEAKDISIGIDHTVTLCKSYV